MKKFIYYLLSSINLSGFITGSAQPKLNKYNLENVKIKVPPLEVQKKIAAVLSSLDDKIELNNKINKNLEQQAQAIFKNYFVENFNSDWEVGTLSDIIDFYNGYAFKSTDLLNEPISDCYKVFKQGHIKKGGGFNYSDTKSWYPISKCKNLSKYILRKGDVLMAMTDMKGNVAILGNTALMNVDNEFILNQRVGLLRSNGYKNTSFAYIYFLTNYFDFVQDLRSRANSGVQVNLSATEIKNSKIFIADEKTNEDFNFLVIPMLKIIGENQQENLRLAEMRDLLLPRLLNGEIDVSVVEI